MGHAEEGCQLTSKVESVVVFTEWAERGWEGAEGGQGTLLEGPEARVEGIDLQDPLAVEGALLRQFQHLG